MPTRLSGTPARRGAGVAAVVGLALVLSALLLYSAGRPDGATSGSSIGAPAVDPASGLPLVALADLPPEAAATVRLIVRGGPYPYERDGLRFGNRERLLPDRPPGWYREYTVPTPGEDDRGARRIVTGDRDREFYYTEDHYASFVRIRR